MNLTGLIEKFRAVALDRTERMNTLLVSLERHQGGEVLAELLRETHTLKGEARMMGFADVNLVTHLLEQLVFEGLQEDPVREDVFDVLFLGLDVLRALLTKSTGLGAMPADLTGFVDQVMAWKQAGPISQLGEPSSVVFMSSSAMPDLQVRKSSVRVEFHHVDELWSEAHTVAGALSAMKPMVEGTKSDLSEVLKEAHKALERLMESVSLMREVSLAEVFSHYPRAVRELARSSGGKRVRMVCEFADVKIDRGTLEGLSDAVLHLIRNAIDHGIETPPERRAAGKPDEGEICLWCSRESNLLKVVVSDDGTGLDLVRIRDAAVRRGWVVETEAVSEEALLDLVFRPGFSTREHAGELSGRGIGMDVVRQKVEELGGEISVQSQFGKGTSIEIFLPMSERSVFNDLGTETLSGPKVLLIDDSDITRALVGGLLRKGGFTVREAIHGEDACEVLNRWSPDVIICDLNMPVMNGIEFLTWLRQNTLCSQIPVLMLSTRGSDFDRKQAANAGANGFVAKLQFDEAELIRAVETCLWEGR